MKLRLSPEAPLREGWDPEEGAGPKAPALIVPQDLTFFLDPGCFSHTQRSKKHNR